MIHWMVSTVVVLLPPALPLLRMPSPPGRASVPPAARGVALVRHSRNLVASIRAAISFAATASTTISQVMMIGGVDVSSAIGARAVFPLVARLARPVPGRLPHHSTTTSTRPSPAATARASCLLEVSVVLLRFPLGAYRLLVVRADNPPAAVAPPAPRARPLRPSRGGFDRACRPPPAAPIAPAIPSFPGVADAPSSLPLCPSLADGFVFSRDRVDLDELFAGGVAPPPAQLAVR